MNINSINDTNFKAIKYTRVLPPTAGKILDKEAKGILEKKIVTANVPERLKNIVDSSPLFNRLGADTDVYISSQCYDESKKNPFWVFVATFMDPYDKAKKTTDEIVFLSHAKDQEKWFDILANSIKKLPERYEFLKDTALEDGFIFIGNNGHAIEGK